MLNFTPGHSIFHPKSIGDSPEGGTVQIVSKKNRIPLSKKDRFVFMDWRENQERSGLEQLEWYMFKYYGRVSSNGSHRIASYEELNFQEKYEYKRTRSDKYNGEPTVYYIHDMDVVFDGSFEVNKYLDDYTYSLKGIYNYNRPQSHYSRRFTNLDEFDFETLINERIYATRTVLGRLFYSLPKENQLEFTLLAMEEFETSELSAISLIEGVKFLNEYTKRITGLGKILIEAKRILDANFSHLLETDKMGFGFERILNSKKESFEIEYASDTISEQVKLFTKAFELENNVQETIEVVTSQNQSLLDSRFKEKFVTKSWPIQINL